MTEEEFDFILIRQKDRILKMINRRQFRDARKCLLLLKELWMENDYGYKYDELIAKSRPL